jgi:hypothetical protein
VWGKRAERRGQSGLQSKVLFEKKKVGVVELITISEYSVGKSLHKKSLRKGSVSMWASHQVNCHLCEKAQKPAL